MLITDTTLRICTVRNIRLYRSSETIITKRKRLDCNTCDGRKQPETHMQTEECSSFINFKKLKKKELQFLLLHNSSTFNDPCQFIDLQSHKR